MLTLNLSINASAGIGAATLSHRNSKQSVLTDSVDVVPSCTIVICTRNRPRELDRCLAAVKHISYPDFDVLVVDNAPEDDRTREVADRWGVRYLAEPVAGLSRARNRGALVCDSDFVAYLDDDAVPTAKWLRALAREFRDPRVMAVTGRTLELNGPDARGQLMPLFFSVFAGRLGHEEACG